MSVTTRVLKYGSRQLVYDLQFRNRRTLGVSVHPDGSIVATAPAGCDPGRVDEAVRKKAAWITEKQLEYAQYGSAGLRPRLYASGSVHPYLGRRYRLTLKQDRDWCLKLLSGRFLLQGPEPGDVRRIQTLFDEWYAARANAIFAEQVQLSTERFANPSQAAPTSISVRAMKLRWGSMSPSGRLLLNPRLIEHSKESIYYVVTHELAHRFVPDHGPRFWKLLQRVMPDWKERKLRLEQAARSSSQAP